MKARLSCLVLAWLLFLPVDAEAQEIKLRAALQVPTSELFFCFMPFCFIRLRSLGAPRRAGHRG